MAKAKATTQQTLTLARRTSTGKRPARRLRREGLVPGIVYGKGTEPLAIAVQARELTKLLRSKAGEHALVTLRLEGLPAPRIGDSESAQQAGGKPWEKPALVKAMQHDPVDGRLVHVDFHAIALTERLKVRVPLILKGEPVGVKQEGGILEHFLREVEVECLPTEMPVSVEFDVSALQIGDTVHVRDLAAPTNTRIITDLEAALASVLAPKEEKVEEAAAAVTEPEVIRERKEETEASAAEAPKDAKGEKPARPSASEGRGGDTKQRPPA